MTRTSQELAQAVRARPYVDFPNGDRSYLIARRELDELVALAEAGERYENELLNVLCSSGVPDYVRRNIERALGENQEA